MNWAHRFNGSTGCTEWWYGVDDHTSRYVEVMFFTMEMHEGAPHIPQGWVYYDSRASGWEIFPESCTTAEECMTYIDVLVRMDEEIL